MGMPAFATCPTRTTLVKFLKVDVYCGLFIVIDLHPYKTLFYFYKSGKEKKIKRQVKEGEERNKCKTQWLRKETKGTGAAKK